MHFSYISHMKLSQLRRFVDLADNGSFSRAAEGANLTQPAFSRSIQQLEEELGFKLFDRIGRENELTAFGRVMLKNAHRVLYEADEFLRMGKLQMEGMAGKIKISLGSTPGAVLTKPLLAWAASQGPNTGISIERGSITQQIHALLQKELDLLVVEATSFSPLPELDIEFLPPLAAGFICRSDHPLTERKQLKFKDIVAWPLGSSLISDAQVRHFVERYGASAHPDKRLSLYCEDLAALLDMLTVTEIVYVGTIAPAKAGLADGSLTLLQIDRKPQPSQFAIVSLASRTKTPIFETVRNLIHENLH